MDVGENDLEILYRHLVALALLCKDAMFFTLMKSVRLRNFDTMRVIMSKECVCSSTVDC